MNEVTDYSNIISVLLPLFYFGIKKLLLQVTRFHAKREFLLSVAAMAPTMHTIDAKEGQFTGLH